MTTETGLMTAKNSVLLNNYMLKYKRNICFEWDLLKRGTLCGFKVDVDKKTYAAMTFICINFNA